MTQTLFYPIHPSIVDLYINALTLHVLEENLGKVGPKGLTQDIQAQVDQAASEYVLSVRRAENIFGNPKHVQLQLNTFTSQRQGTA
jgi:hypothetical protein